MNKSNELKLCYVDGNFAYFTTQELSEQWGDDWNDAPYEHNAGWPATPFRHYKGGCDCLACKRDWNEDGTPKWIIKKVAFDGPFDLPCDGYHNSPYSVQEINAGAVAWLYHEDSNTSIMAGTSIDDFMKLVIDAGGRLYVEKEELQDPHDIDAAIIGLQAIAKQVAR